MKAWGNARKVMVVLGVSLGTASFLPAQVTWDGGAATGAWGTGTNWDTDSVPGSGDDVQFDADTANSQFTISPGGNRTMNSLTFLDATTAQGFTFSSNQIRIGSGGLSNLDDQTQSFNVLYTTANQTWNLTGDISATTNLNLRNNLTLTGSGTVNLLNRFTNNANVILTINNTGGVDTLDIRLRNTVTIAGSEDLNVSGVIRNYGGNRTFTNDSTGTVTVNGILLSDQTTSNKTLTIGGSGDTLVTGVVSDGNSTASGLTKTGTGNLTLEGANTYDGATTLSAGTLTLANDTALGTVTGSTTINASGTLALTNDISVAEAITNNGAIDNVSGSNTLSGVISGSGTVDVDAGSLTLSGANTYTGVTSVNAGTLTLENNAALGDVSGSTTVGASGTLALTNNISVGEAITNSGAIDNVSGANTLSGVVSGSGTMNVDAGTLTLTGANTYSGATTVAGSSTLNIGAGGTTGAVSGNITNSGTVQFDRSNAYSFGGVISGSGDVEKNGSGTTTFTSAQTYSGDTDITAGTLQLSGSGRLSDSTAVTVTSPGTFDLNNISDTVGSIAGSGNITLGSGTLTAGDNDSSTDFTGTISGTGGLTKSGTGTLLLNGTNTFTGTTTVNEGTLAVDGSNNVDRLVNGADVVINDGGTFEVRGVNALGTGDANAINYTVNSGGTLSVVSGASAASPTTSHTHIGDLTLDGGTVEFSYSGSGTAFDGESAILRGSINVTDDSTIQYGSGGDSTNAGLALNNTASITVDPGVTFTVDVEVEEGAPAGADGIEKLGTGNLVLSQTNTYAGDTTVSAGTVTLSADNALGTGSTTVASGGTLALTGGITAAQTGYTLAGTGVGGTAGAIQNVSGDNRLTGDLTLSADTTIQATAGTLNVGTFWDISGFVTATDTLDTAGNTLTFDGAGNTVLAAELDGSGNVIKNGTGTLTFENSRNRDWTGTTTINDGELISRNLFNNGTPGAPGTANYTFNDTVTVGDGTGAAGSATLTIGTNDRGAIAGFNHKNAFADGVDLVINSDGRFNTRGHEQYVQDVTLDGGTIDAWTNANAVVESLFITGSITATESSTINGKIDLNGDAAKVIDVQDSGETLDITALIDNGGFDKQGDGILELSGVNTYTGNVDISEGIVLLESNSGLGAVAGSTNVDSGAQLQLSGVTVGAEALTLNGSGISSDGALQTVASSGANSWAGNITLGSATEIEVSSASSLTISGSITGAQTLTVDGPGNSTFTGTNTFNTLNKTGGGTLTLSSGTKTIPNINVSGGTLDLGTSNIITDTADLSISGTGTFSMGGGISETINSVDITGGTLDLDGNLTIDQFTQSNGTLDVDGVLTLNGGTISGGDGSDSSGTMVLTAGNTLNITNDYEFGGTLELTAGTTLALSGASTIDIGTLNITGDTTIDFGADANRLDLGALTIAGGVSVTVNNWISFQDLWTTGSFQGGSGSVTIDERDSNTAQITFSGFSPSDTIWLTFDFGSNEITVPEPGTYGATLMAFGLVLWTIRRRPRKAVKQL